MYETIIWATDGSEGADAALDEALRLAELQRRPHRRRSTVTSG